MDSHLHRPISSTGEAVPLAVDPSASAPAFSGDNAGAEELRAARSMESHVGNDLPDAFMATFPVARLDSSVAASLAEHVEGGTTPVGDTTQFPFRTVCHLHICARDGSEWRGTAFFASPHTLITAGHNVFMPTRGGWVTKVIIAPGRNGSVRPYGEFESRRFFSVQGWTAAHDPNYDYGAILLENPIGTRLGHFGLHEPQEAEMGNPVDLAGYPEQPGRQFFARGRVRQDNSLRLYYDAPTGDGHSGAPVYFDGNPLAIAVHAYDSGQFNSGVRINAAVHAQMRAWLA